MSTALIAALAMTNSAPFEIKNGDRVLFYGDSITEQRLYTTYVETFVRTRYPKLDAEFIMCGVGGDCTWGGWTAASDERVRRDVKPEKPTVVTIMLGMNDGGYVPFEQRIFDIFKEWYGKLLGWMHDAVPNARITLLNSPPFDDWAHPNNDFKGYSDTVKRFGDYVGLLAKERKFGFVDTNKPITDLIQASVKKDPKKAAEISPDGIHPGPSGHLIIAAKLLDSWQVSGLVSDVKIDISKSSVLSTENAKVSEMNGMEWTQLDNALPFPTQAPMAPAIDFLDFNRTLNRQMLTVTGLESGKYRLEIDGEKVVELTSEDWAKGINLAPLKTPMLTQAEKVMELTIQRNEAFFTRWRDIDFTLKDYPSTPAASQALRKLTKEIGEAQKKATQPKPRKFRLIMALK